MKVRIKARGISGLAVSGLAILFVLSLSFHNHALNIGMVDKKISQSQPANPHISNEFCSGCRLNGKFKPQDRVAGLAHKLSEIVISFSDLNVLLPYLSLASKKSTRSPPVI
ncbi:MAG TPA: hypothetical protein VNN20_15990 [Thermodesulfobacteriota bacterium]|jgi:hypothetical protein|nr:hypothetical protein [Thermodesulfobacteriota bacterium]